MMDKKNKNFLAAIQIIWVSIILFILFWGTAFSQVILENDPTLDKIDVVEKLGNKIPPGLIFTDESGAQINFDTYFADNRPVILVMAYYTCPMLCNLVLNGLADAARQIDYNPGEEYRIVTVSIDPTETNLIAGAKKKNYMQSLNRPGLSDDAWHFLVGEESQSKALAEAIGFKYFYDESREEYAHPAVLTILSPERKVTRYLYGIRFHPRDLRLALLESSEGKIGTTLDRIILYCFHYDSQAGGYVLFAQNAMKLGGLTTLLILTALLGFFWLKERRRKATNQLTEAEIKSPLSRP
jgi:protein SCO1/2